MLRGDGEIRIKIKTEREHFCMSSRLIWLGMKKLLFLVMLGMASPLFSAGLIVIEDPRHWPEPMPHVVPPPRLHPPRYIPPPRRWAPLEVTSVQANVRIKDQVANTSIEQEFYNPNSQQLEGTFLLPVPKGAHIDRFAMEIDGKKVQAELLAAEKAREIYENIVRQAKDPALLEYAGQDVFKVRIFPIEPHSKKRISLSWVQVLKGDSGVVSYVFPLNTERFSAKPVKNVGLKIELESKRPLKSIYSPSHKVDVKRQGEHRATIGYESHADAGADRSVRVTGGASDSDFQLLFAEEEGEFGASLLTHRTGDEDGYFLLLVSPSAELKADRVMAKDVIFVLDNSGSMAGNKLEQAKKALLFCVENLNENDRFEVIRFSTEVEGVFDKLVDATRENRSRAEEFIKDLKPTGGTAIDDALRKALSSRPSTSQRPYIVVFLTDGRPTMGVTDEDEILKNVKKRNGDNTRVFVFGIGTDVNTHLLDKIAEQTKAFSQYVLPEEDIEVKVSNFFTKIKEPVLANPKLVLPQEVRVTKMYPSPLPDLFKGEQLIVAGRYSGRGSGKLRIEGTVNGKAREFGYDVKFADADHEFIPRLWATRRVGYLLDEIRLRGDNKELRDEVTELARKYGIVTPYTTYLIVEDERQRGLTENRRTLRLDEWEEGRRELSAYYDSFSRDKSGDSGVAASQSAEFLKRAEAPVAAVSGADSAARRPATMAQRPSSVPMGIRSRGQVIANEPPRHGETAKSAETRFVNGRAFYRNGDAWVDSELQRAEGGTALSPDGATKKAAIRIEFGSPEYFELLRKEPQVRSWVSLGTNVQFVLRGQVYEIWSK
jgi:Ca-activated chloride channel homolog